MKTRIGVILMAAVLALYIIFAGQRGVMLVTTGDPIAIAMGVALIVLPLVGAWALWREISFGRHAERLGKVLETEGALPEESVKTYPSGRPRREEGDALFPQYREAVETNPQDWRAWYRMGLVYDAAGDRARARRTIRKAISVERASRKG